MEDLISALGLQKVASSAIGGTAQGKARGISGGERKRLAFASEVLTNPSVLFADEPTSGLDSFMAESVVDMMKDLAHGGRTIVATIHQPASDVYAKFDRLLLVCDGVIVYYGDREEAVDYFASLGHQCPTFVNPADYFIRVRLLQRLPLSPCHPPAHICLRRRYRSSLPVVYSSFWTMATLLDDSHHCATKPCTRNGILGLTCLYAGVRCPPVAVSDAR